MVTFIDIHTHNKYVGNNKILYNLKSNEFTDYQYCSYGIHPWDLCANPNNSLFDKLSDYCKQGVILAVGEIGIDRAINYPLDQQIEFFKQQHALAEKYNLPVIIHCVKAWSDFLAIQNQIKPNIPWIFHGYNGNGLIAKKLISKGFYLSFGQHLMESTKIQEVFKTIPLDKLFLETDNSGEKIENIYQKAADLLHIPIFDLEKQIELNFGKVFKSF